MFALKDIGWIFTYEIVGIPGKCAQTVGANGTGDECILNLENMGVEIVG